MRQAAEGRRELEEELGEDGLEDAMAGVFAAAQSTRAAQSYHLVMQRNAGIGGGLHDLDLPERILEADETVLEVAVGGLSDDTFPLLIVTDRRVLVTKDLPWNRWKILREEPTSDIAGATLRDRLLSGQLIVHLRHGEDISFRVAARERSEHVVAFLQELADSGNPPPT